MLLYWGRRCKVLNLLDHEINFACKRYLFLFCCLFLTVEKGFKRIRTSLLRYRDTEPGLQSDHLCIMCCRVVLTNTLHFYAKRRKHGRIIANQILRSTRGTERLPRRFCLFISANFLWRSSSILACINLQKSEKLY